jgi:hypothetical protein
MVDKLTQAQMHTLVCTFRKSEHKDHIGSWESPQAIKRAELLRKIEIQREERELNQLINKDYL